MPSPDDAIDPHRSLRPDHQNGRSRATRISIGVVIVGIWVHWLPETALMIVIGCGLAIALLEREIGRLGEAVQAEKASHLEMRARAKETEEKLAAAETLVQSLRRKIDELEARHHRSPGFHPLYSRVGLASNCPVFLLKVARTAYRKNLHPDGRPPHHKAEAERRFKEAEAVFDEIWRLRGF